MPGQHTNFDEFASALAHEALSEAADNFFGRRVALERDEERIRQMAVELHRLAEQALDEAALLARVLLETSEGVAFFKHMGVDISEEEAAAFFCALRERPLKKRPEIPKAMTRGGRFKKFFYEAYGQARHAFRDYLRGRLVQEHSRAPKRVSLHYEQLKEWCDAHNGLVKETNNNHSPSCVISFCKQMTGDSLDKERLMGGGGEGMACNLDASLALRPIEFDSLDLPLLPALPSRTKHRAKVLAFASALYDRRRQEADALLEQYK